MGIGPQALTLVMVGNLIAYKGHGDLLVALGQAAPQLPPDWRLLIVGRDEGIASALQAQSVALGIDRNVLFLDTRNDVPDILNACDIGVLCSHQEGFSNAVLEGMAASLPMIVTDVGGNAEAVLDGECGIVVPAERSAASRGRDRAVGQCAGIAYHARECRAPSRHGALLAGKFRRGI